MRADPAAAALAALIALHMLPDPALTPGGFAAGDSLAQICAPGYAASHRLFQADRAGYWRLADAVLAEYGIAARDRGRYEIDDRVPLCLGGRQTVVNLWPQTRGGGVAALKDALEARVCRRVCAGRMSLAEGRTLFLLPSWIEAARWLLAGPAAALRPAPASGCCKTCRKGVPCGNSCVAPGETCRKGPGCACAGETP
ncbi:MAG TPA: hypothetical protein VGR91_08025 [Stellaceae bacterium]|nr:hypothetical protein [Stellaceae bacterium]